MASEQGEAGQAGDNLTGLADWAAVKLQHAQEWDVPDGYELVAFSDDLWRIETGKLCTKRVGRGTCRQPSVAAVNRTQYRPGPGFWDGRRVDAWWPICLEHFLGFGHWLEGRTVMSWRLEKPRPDVG